MAEFFEQLNSNDARIVEESKQKFCELFTTVKEPWLVNGLYDHFIATNSVPVLEVLINVRDSHHDYLFNKLHESLVRGTNEIKFQALILLGHVVRKHPTWLYKITEKALFKELLKLLKTETDILLLLSALLLLIVLLPCIPSLMGPHLQDVFDIFSRLAAFNSSITVKMGEDQLVHMQVGLYALLQRLYGMYPCNFLAYLRNYYKNKEAFNIFKHTIKPMLQTVQMHPLLVTSTKDYELSTERWKEMNAHDVVVECERYSIGLRDRFMHDACIASGSAFRSRSGTTNSTTLESYQLLKSIQGSLENELFSPTQMMNYIQTTPLTNEIPASAIPVVSAHPHQNSGQNLLSSVKLQSQEGTSPPEAAIEATPETTPIKDTRLLSSTRQQQHSIAHMSVARALNNFGGRNRTPGISSSNTTPTHSQPSSPMRFSNKEASSAFNFTQSSNHNADFHFHHHQVHRSAFNQPTHSNRESLVNQKLSKLIQDRSQVSETPAVSPYTQLPPTSPLRLIPPEHINNQVKRTESPISQEDEEVQLIVKKTLVKQAPVRQCDSVLQDHDHDDADYEQGSPCTSGGLHMPSSRQMTAFKNNMKRLRHHSQCAAESDITNETNDNSPDMRRANSCPEMKKGVNTPSTKEGLNKSKTLEEKDEELPEVNGVESEGKKKKVVIDMTTQTENIWPMPYEHLFLSIFPTYESTEVKPSPAPSPAPLLQADKFNYSSSYDILDKYMDVTLQYHPHEVKDPVKSLRDQLQLVQQQLMFERTRRETHATKNRTLFTDVTKIKVLEEHNSALTDQVKLQEKDIDNLKQRVARYKDEQNIKEQAQFEKVLYWEDRYRKLDNELQTVLDRNENLQRELQLAQEKLQEVNNKWQNAESSLANTEAEINVYKEQVLAGERGRLELEQVNRELLLAGEAITKYREILADLSVKNLARIEMTRLTETYQQEVKLLHNQLESKSLTLEAYRSRLVELDSCVQQHDNSLQAQKKIFKEVKEDCHEKMKALDSKYQSQLCINRALEIKVLELYQQQDLSSRQGLHSPDTSSCHEVNASTERTAGMSPHSSPLSASLTSSEGSAAFMHGELKEMKSLQAMVDQKETTVTKSNAPDIDQTTDTGTTNLQTQMASTSKQTD